MARRMPGQTRWKGRVGRSICPLGTENAGPNSMATGLTREACKLWCRLAASVTSVCSLILKFKTAVKHCTNCSLWDCAQIKLVEQPQNLANLP